MAARGEGASMVNDEREQAIRQVAGEVARHLTWLRDAGVRELPVPVARPAVVAQPAAAAVAATAAAAAGRRPVAPSPSPAPPAEAGAGEKGVGSPELTAVRADLGDCRRCKLAAGRTTLVFGVGAPRAELMFVGEGPGADEDLQGEPFVGKAGQLLTRMIEAMGYRRDQVYIANVVKCRPPENRNPEPDEIVACEPFLMRQIDAVRPKVIVALGKFAAHTLLRSAIPITRLRGTWGQYQGVKLMPTFHPAYLLRSPHEKAKAWEDLKQVVVALGRQLPAPGGRQG
jgi:uracil-DNA glycosylase family 4